MSFKSGFVSIIGRPNTGKSTLLNSILGEKVVIVSEKPQTTRNRIRGIKNMENAQIIFLDTPGIHKAKGHLNEFMVKEAMSALEDMDIIIYLVEATGKIKDELFIIESLKRVRCPVLLGINKIDMVRKDSILPLMDEYSSVYPFREIIPLSARKGEGMDELFRCIVELLPEGPKYFTEDILTDQTERFVVAEIVREKVFELTREEIPYSTAVIVERFKENPGKRIISISATINVERDSQKGIIIGKGGAMLKEIGTRARIDIERLLGTKVYLGTVREGTEGLDKGCEVIKGIWIPLKIRLRLRLRLKKN